MDHTTPVKLPGGRNLGCRPGHPHRGTATWVAGHRSGPPAHAEITGSTAERLPEVHTNATTDLDLLSVWLKAHTDGSPHTRRAYERIGHRFVEALAAAGTNLKRATVEDVQTALEAMRMKADGT